jgi:hypothetical protein
MIAHNQIANSKYSRYFEELFKDYYVKQNDVELVDMNETNPYATYDYRDDVHKYFIEVRSRKEYQRGYLTYIIFNKQKLENLYELQSHNRKYKILNYLYIYNDEDGAENYKLYCINLLDLIGENLATCVDNQNKTCYKIPMSQYILIRDYGQPSQVGQFLQNPTT